MNAKLSKLQRLLVEQELDALLVTEKVTKRYLQTLDGSGCRVFLTATKGYLIVDGRYYEQALALEHDLEIVLWNPQIEGVSYLQWISNFMAIHDLHRIGIEPTLSIDDYQTLQTFAEVVILPDALIKLRMLKDAVEIDKLKRAIALTDDIYAQVLTEIKVGMTDFEIAARLQYHAIAQGATGMAFDTIIGLGERSAYPHARPVGKRVEPNQIILIDFGIILDGFQSDMTRVCSIGEPAAEIKSLFTTVLAANNAAIAAVKVGVKACEVDTVARQVITDAGYGVYFTHGLGHGIGMDDATELPKLNQENTLPLQAGMVFSCEPGIYIPNVGGIRLEDDIWLSAQGPIVLDQTPKDFQILQGDGQHET
ncbi:MAG: Xaa-Pro peptidase family protein [Lactobacillaceae bacterium]|jgi:Xaa-Pro aminopeptidase|nr:Xaa-Pro peptidase family protein [Lactobacillaceae bacterium]